MMVVPVELAVLILLAVISDIRTCKIKNSIIIIFTAAGLATGIINAGMQGLAYSLAGAAIPLVLLFILYALKMLGAGDIKLLCAAGAIGGAGFIPYGIAYSFLSGGLIALVIMLLRKNAGKRARHFLSYIKSCFLSRSLLPYTDLPDRSDGAKFRFSIAIACGTFTAIFQYL
jgi:prepilin peptidase CpaA